MSRCTVVVAPPNSQVQELIARLRDGMLALDRASLVVRDLSADCGESCSRLHAAVRGAQDRGAELQDMLSDSRKHGACALSAWLGVHTR